MKFIVTEPADEVVDPERGGALTYEAMNGILRRMLIGAKVEIEFADGSGHALSVLDNGWVGLERTPVDREAKTKRVGIVPRS